MVVYKTGDIFDSPAQVITNTVNCVGVMGKGLAREFKKKFPAMYNDYKTKCHAGKVVPGRPYLWEDDRVQILNFPTKRHWRQGSFLSDVEEGLKYLAETYAKMGITSLALPPLGCGNGGLDWSEVKNLINKYLGPIEVLDVYVYELQSMNSQLKNKQNNTSKPSTERGGIAAQSDQFSGL